MISSLRLALVASALIALPGSLLAEDAGACCAATKATAAAGECCAAGKTAASGECCASSGQYVMIKVKGKDTARLATALGKVDGVSGVETCTETKFTKIAYSKSKACPDTILAAVKDAGYRVETRRVAFAVEGMACGACADKVSKALTKVRGVSDVKVCTESKTATVDFNPGRVKGEQLVAALDAAGFKSSEALN